MTDEEVSDLAMNSENACDQIQEATIDALDPMPNNGSAQGEEKEAPPRGPLATKGSARRRFATKPLQTRRRLRRSRTGSRQSDRGTLIALSKALGEADKELVHTKIKLAVSEAKCRYFREQNGELKSLRVRQETESRRAQIIRSFILIGGGLGAGMTPNVMSIQGIAQYALAATIAVAVLFFSEVRNGRAALR
jgi:hypothetical protein